MTAAERQTRATSADELCRQAYAASGGPATGVALVAVGGYGRAELAPHSDLDLVLVHEDDVDLGELGSALWYPLWDSGRRLDHSVRSMSQVLEAAADLRVALGLLDARHLAGDPGLTLRLRTTTSRSRSACWTPGTWPATGTSPRNSCPPPATSGGAPRCG